MQASKWVRATVMAGVSGTAMLSSQYAMAAGFALLEQNASGLGNAYAGAAAVAEDASTLFFNSAGLTQLKHPSVVMSVAGINVNSKFHDEDPATTRALGQPSRGGNGGDAGGFTALPALYVAVPVNESIAGGIGVNAPFGLKTEYDSDWIGRFQAIKSEVKTLNINTALAFKLSKTLSLGMGVNFQTLDAELTSALNYTALIAANSGGLLILPGLEGTSRVKGDDSTWGYDVGLLFIPTESTHIGLSYRSALKYHLVGSASFTAPTTTNPTGQFIINQARNSATTAAAPTDGAIALDLKLPATARLAIKQALGDSVELLGEVSWTGWSSVPELKIVRTQGAVGTLKNTPEKWEDTMRYALGANFKINDRLKLRAGAAFDESPVPDSTRTPRLPDADRTWVAAGAQMKMGDRIAVDLGYTHIFVKDAKLNQNDGNTSAYGLLLGTHKTALDILAVQATVSF